MRMSSQNRLVPLLFVLGPHMCCMNQSVYKCSYTRFSYPKMKAERGLMAQATSKVEYNIPAGFRPIELRRTHRDGFHGESICARPLDTGAKATTPRKLSSFGPALELDGGRLYCRETVGV